jgi:regulator of protease activity HflC (stomatin/prohibitin superfamily)
MSGLLIVVVGLLLLLGLGLSVRVVKQYEQGMLFRLGRVVGVRQPGLRLIGLGRNSERPTAITNVLLGTRTG